MTLKLKVNADEVKQALGDVRKRFEDPRDMLREIGDIITEDIKHRIVKLKKDPQDTPWEPWAESTRKGRVRKGNAALGLLFDTGRLLRSITAEVKNRGKKGGWALFVGTNVKYATYLQNGTEKMPARPFLGVSKRAQSSIDQAIKLYADTALKGKK